MKKAELKKAIVDRCVCDDQGRKKLKCQAAFEISVEFAVATGIIGQICNEENIKICNCQLGCF